MPLGIVTSNLSPGAFQRFERDDIILPLAADVDYFSAATAGGAQGNQSISAATAGTACFLSAIATAAPVRYGRLPTLSITDASFGSALVVTVRIIGRRFGKRVVQDITATSTDTSIKTVAGTIVIDEITSASITAISNNTTSDILSLGFDGTRIGLRVPFQSVKSVKFMEKIVSGTPDANAGATAGAAGAIATTGSLRAGSVLQASTVVFPADGSVNVAVLYNNVAIAATDRFIIEYVAGGLDEFERTGKKYA
jgi:hypothetical protein